MEDSKKQKLTLEEQQNLLYDFLKKFSNLELDKRIDTNNIIKLIPTLLDLQSYKEGVYGQSWKKHSHLGIFLGVERKWDRLEKMMDTLMKHGTDSLKNKSIDITALMDTLTDITVYSMLWSTYLMENYPEEWKKYISNIRNS